MSRRNRDSKKYYRYAAAVMLAVFLVSAAFLALTLWEREQGKYPVQNVAEESVSYQGKKYRLKENVETFLALGLDQYENASANDSYNNDKRADFLALFVFDHDAKACSVIQISRDTMAEIGVLGVAGDRISTVTGQIALAHTYGNGDDISCRNTADAVSQLLRGVRVDHYLSVTMDAVPIYNDLVGGVEVTVMDDFSGIDDTLVKGETVLLNGEQALTYVRTRYQMEDSSNNARMVRQRQYLEQLQEKTRQCVKNDQEFLLKAATGLSEYLVSDRSVTQLEELGNKFYDYRFDGILTLEGEAVKGAEYMEFYPDTEALQALVIRLFYEPKG